MKTIGRTAVALGLAGAMTASAVPAISTPAMSAPVPSSTAALKQGIASDLEQVRWRGRGGGWAAAGVGFAAGALVGSAIANSNRGYYGGYGYYGDPYYGAPLASGGYYNEPVYAAPAPVYRAAPGGRCWISTGADGRYGYWSAC
jgi:hypothetical protein